MRKCSVAVMVLGLILRDFFLQQYTFFSRESLSRNILGLNAEGNLMMSRIITGIVIIFLIVYLCSRDAKQT